MPVGRASVPAIGPPSAATRVLRNEPNFGHLTRSPRPNPAARVRGEGSVCETNPISRSVCSPERTRRSHLEELPSSGRAGGACQWGWPPCQPLDFLRRRTGPHLRNEPNPGAVAPTSPGGPGPGRRAPSAKRTQSRVPEGSQPRGHRSRGAGDCRRVDLERASVQARGRWGRRSAGRSAQGWGTRPMRALWAIALSTVIASPLLGNRRAEAQQAGGLRAPAHSASRTSGTELDALRPYSSRDSGSYLAAKARYTTPRPTPRPELIARPAVHAQGDARLLSRDAFGAGAEPQRGRSQNLVRSRTASDARGVPVTGLKVNSAAAAACAGPVRSVRGVAPLLEGAAPPGSDRPLQVGGEVRVAVLAIIRETRHVVLDRRPRVVKAGKAKRRVHPSQFPERCRPRGPRRRFREAVRGGPGRAGRSRRPCIRSYRRKTASSRSGESGL